MGACGNCVATLTYRWTRGYPTSQNFIPFVRAERICGFWICWMNVHSPAMRLPNSSRWSWCVHFINLQGKNYMAFCGVVILAWNMCVSQAHTQPSWYNARCNSPVDCYVDLLCDFRFFVHRMLWYMPYDSGHMKWGVKFSHRLTARSFALSETELYKTNWITWSIQRVVYLAILSYWIWISGWEGSILHRGLSSTKVGTRNL